MRRKTNLTLEIFLCLFVLGTATVGCGKQKSNTSESSTAPTDPVGGGDHDPNKTWLSQNFPAGVSTYLHLDSDINSICEVTPSSTNPDRKTCILDVGELDLQWNEFTLKFNVPANKCDYVRVIPYFYWNREPGVGPSTISYSVSENGDVNSLVGSNVSIVNNKVTCNYDYTHLDGPNCCTGNYVATVRTYTDPTTSTYATVSSSWGGKFGGCGAGPGMLKEWADAGGEHLDPKTGLPYPYIFWAKDGFTKEFKVPKPTVYTGFNIRSSNWMNSFTSPPAALTKYAQDHWPIDTTHTAYYRWECLDHAEEILADVKLLIREWNLLSELDKYISGDLLATPDSGGVENGTYPVNDRADWDDVILLPGRSQYPQL